MHSRATAIVFLLLTYLFTPCGFFVSFLRRRTGLARRARSARFLIIQSARIGDMVCVTPAFREIKKHYPTAYIATVVAEPATGVSAHNPHIDEFFYYDPARTLCSALRLFVVLALKRFDYSLNFFPGLLGNALPFWLGIPFRASTTITKASRALRLLFPFSNIRMCYKKEDSAPEHHLKLLQTVGIAAPDGRREVFKAPHAEERVRDFLARAGNAAQATLVGIGIGCGKDFRKWPLERFVELADWILERYPTRIVLVGGREDAQDAEQFLSKIRRPESIYNGVGIFSVADLPSLFSRIALFISVSTGPLYIADAMGCKTIDIIGTDSAANQAPQGQCIVVQRDDFPSCSYVMYPPECSPQLVGARMDIPVAQVQNAVSRFLSSPYVP